jgi:hypothetical protein
MLCVLLARTRQNCQQCRPHEPPKHAVWGIMSLPVALGSPLKMREQMEGHCVCRSCICWTEPHCQSNHVSAAIEILQCSQCRWDNENTLNIPRVCASLTWLSRLLCCHALSVLAHKPSGVPWTHCALFLLQGLCIFDLLCPRSPSLPSWPITVYSSFRS